MTNETEKLIQEMNDALATAPKIIVTDEKSLFKGQVYRTSGVTLGAVYIVDLTENQRTGVEYVVYAKTFNPYYTAVIERGKFETLIDRGALTLEREPKYKRGQAFYSQTGNVFLIQYPSDIHHDDDIGTRYFVTVIEAFVEYCDEINKPRYILTEAILREDHLDSLEPATDFMDNIAKLELGDLETLFNHPKPGEGVNDCTAKSKGFIK